ncbi:MAG: AbrB/MazE/SpoVT family DNA-binding domain-containing protein [Clostridia bacterium]|nr:AbrB/MazE/SpoVT family DNA-binding domain-containing protein [Clostridia bacterium]
MMYGRIQRWGNSQGIRLPKGVLNAANLRENDEVEIFADPGEIKIRKGRRYESLDALFAGYAGDYSPVEFDAGADVGLEVLD